ncbi:MAG: hypothetical protein ABIH18_02015 [Candidatus Omnitrophota bacterium]
MKKKIKKRIYITIILLFGVLFVIKFAGSPILRLYLESGIGSCKEIPIFCIIPNPEPVNQVIDQEYNLELVEYQLPQIQINVPKEFKVIKQNVTKMYYKKKKFKTKDPVMYLVYEPPGFFIGLFPHLKKQDINNDYEFISRIMSTKMNDVNNLIDAFFMVMKGIFIPDLGNQQNVDIVRFTGEKQKGFIGYNLNEEENYFNCDIITDEGYFKVYIKDSRKKLDLEKVLSIISTIKKIDSNMGLVN